MIVDLGRQFRDLTEKELEEPELLAYYNDTPYGAGFAWPHLLERRRTILLAEAGSGKSVEMEFAAEGLRRKGSFAIYVPLEAIALSDLEDVAPDQVDGLEAWQRGDQPGWLFLDSVDELRLTRAKLRTALTRAARPFARNLDRLRVTISSRPSDWRRSEDVAQFRAAFPIADTARKIAEADGDSLFLQTLDREAREEAAQSVESETSSKDDFAAVVLLPLGDEQIKTLARHNKVLNPEAFLRALSAEDAMAFARRPLDLIDLAGVWNYEGRLGTRIEQHERNVEVKLRDHPDRADLGVLSDEKARVGAERLALAVSLTRRRTVLAPDVGPSDDPDASIDPAHALPDWTPHERSALLRRALFDPATYGRVRFHHRSVQEYLAARRIRTLREQGLGVRDMLRLLFATCYGIHIVIPSMRPVAAWLAVWDTDVRRELRTRSPETLLEAGDPASFDLSVRIRTLREFAERYAKGGDRGLNVPIGEVARFAAPELGPTVRELWEANPENPDVRELLLETIWKGPIPDCADIAASAAMDASERPYHRIAAIRALVAVDGKNLTAAIVRSMLDPSADWPARVVVGACEALFPDHMDVGDLLALIERTDEPETTLGGFDWHARLIAERLDPFDARTSALRDGMAELLWRGRSEQSHRWHMVTRFAHLREALSILCRRQIEANAIDSPEALGRASALAYRMGGSGYVSNDQREALASAVRAHPTVRQAAFWADVELLRSFSDRSDDFLVHEVSSDGVTGQLFAADADWLEAAVNERSDHVEREVALRGRLIVASDLAWSSHLVERLISLVEHDTALAAVIQQCTRELTPEERAERQQREDKREARKAKQAEEKKARHQDWLDWRAELVADPERMFRERTLNTIDNVYRWMGQARISRNHLGRWDRDAIAAAFSKEVVDRLQQALMAHWRSHTPKLWSEREPDERNSIFTYDTWGASGLIAESETEGWTKRLTPEEARLAVRYATVELNGFAPFTDDLVRERPDAIRDVLGPELERQFAVLEEDGHVPLLHDLAYHGQGIVPLLSDPYLDALERLPPDIAERSRSNIDTALTIGGRLTGPDDLSRFIECCARRFNADPSGPFAAPWLYHWARHDGPGAMGALLAAFPAPLAEEDKVNIAVFLTALFERDRGTDLSVASMGVVAETLESLVVLAFDAVDPAEDIHHEGSYTPDERDKAQQARGHIFGALMNMPGPDAHAVRLRLADSPTLNFRADRIRMLDRERVALDAEPTPLTARDCADLEHGRSAPAKGKDELHAVMLDRLADIAHDIAHHDFTQRETYRNVHRETEMQPYLASLLHEKRHGAYEVTREEEVADGKMPDIRLVTPDGQHRAAIEIKIAESWTLAELREALETQLIGQYLRHDRCRVGCLLITCGTEGREWDGPSGRRSLGFPTLIELLEREAEELSAAAGYEFTASVVGIDLT